MVVKVRTVGNSTTLTVPVGIKVSSDEYQVSNEGDKIVFTPVEKHTNIFATAEWQDYDYQKDVAEDPALQPVKSVGRELQD